MKAGSSSFQTGSVDGNPCEEGSSKKNYIVCIHYLALVQNLDANVSMPPSLSALKTLDYIYIYLQHFKKIKGSMYQIHMWLHPDPRSLQSPLPED